MDGNKIFDVSELFRCYFDLFTIFLRCFFSMFCLSMFCLFRVFAFLCFVVLCFVIDPYSFRNILMSEFNVPPKKKRGHTETGPLFKVFSSTNCPYRGVKVTCFGKSVKVLIGEFTTFTIKSLQNNTSNVIGNWNLMKILTLI